MYLIICINSKSTKKYLSGTNRFIRTYYTVAPEEILNQLFKQLIKIVNISWPDLTRPDFL
jgi:hypothetical protein